MKETEPVLYDSKNKPITILSSKGIKRNMKTSEIKIIDPNLETKVKLFENGGILLELEHIPSIDLTKFTDMIQDYMIESGAVNKGLNIKVMGYEGDYKLYMCFNKNDINQPIKNMQDVVKFINPNLSIIPKGIEELLGNINNTFIKENNGNKILPDNIICYKEENSESYFYTDGMPTNEKCEFAKVLKKYIELKEQTNNHVDLFNNGIPSNILNNLFYEATLFTKRGKAFYKDISDEFEFQYSNQNNEDLIYYLSKAYSDFERARTIYEFIIEKDKEDDPRYLYRLNSRINYSSLLVNNLALINEVVKITGDFDYMKRTKDRYIVKIQEMMDYVKDNLYNSIKENFDYNDINNEDEEWYNSEPFNELSNGIMYLQNIKINLSCLEYDSKAQENMKLCLEEIDMTKKGKLKSNTQNIIVSSVFSPLEMPNDELYQYYVHKKMYQKANELQKEMNHIAKTDPLYLNTPMRSK
jgi:hypothetical protein